MAQSMSVVMSNPYAKGDNKIECSWVCGTTGAGDAGAVTQSICSNYNSDRAIFDIKPSKIEGYIVRVVTNPSATAPTDDYDITITDADGVDVMAGALANRDTANSEQVIPSDPPYVNSELTVNISTAGEAKEGVIIIYVSK